MELSVGLFPIPVLPFFEAWDIVNLVKNCITSQNIGKIPGISDDKLGECQLITEAAKWLTWKAEGLPEETAQKLAQAYPKAKDLVVATTPETMIKTVGAEASEQVNLILHGDYFIE